MRSDVEAGRDRNTAVVLAGLVRFGHVVLMAHGLRPFAALSCIIRRMTPVGGSSEELIWEGRPTWKAWPGKWILGWILLPVLVGAFLLIPVAIATRSKRWKLTSKRIEVENGWLSKKIDTLELWRIRDLEFRQSLMDRMVGVATITITAHDDRDPVLEIRGGPPDRAIYDRLMSAVMQARQQRGVMNLNP